MERSPDDYGEFLEVVELINSGKLPMPKFGAYFFLLGFGYARRLFDLKILK